MKKIEYCEILSNEAIAEDIYSMTVAFPWAGEVAAGQFANLYTDRDAFLLPRPLSICETGKDTLRFVYRVVGAGTELFAQMRSGGRVRVLAPLGQGFRIPPGSRRICVAGGGLGVPPMLELAKAARAACPGAEIEVLTAFRSEPILTEDFRRLGFEPRIATEDGNVGFKGNIVELLKKQPGGFDLICACGPKPMLRGVAGAAEEWGVPCQVSMEERMACGVGACVGCVTGIRDGDGFVYAKVCKEGPVFNAEEVVWG